VPPPPEPQLSSTQYIPPGEHSFEKMRKKLNNCHGMMTTTIRRKKTTRKKKKKRATRLKAKKMNTTIL
jgi:hypothetical protein